MIYLAWFRLGAAAAVEAAVCNELAKRPSNPTGAGKKGKCALG